MTHESPGETIWQALLARAEAYCTATATNIFALSRALTGNPSLLSQNGGARTLATIDKVARRLTILESNPEQLIYRTARERMAELENPDGQAQAEHDADRRERHRRQGEAVP